MNIISKEKKEIRWLGLPTNSAQELTSLENEKAERLERIKTKTKQLQDLILQQIAFKETDATLIDAILILKKKILANLVLLRN